MLVFEMFEPMPDGYREEKDDQSVLKLSDLRKTRLSLEQIHRMRIMNDVRKIEHEKKLEKIHKQYAAAAAEGAAGAGSMASV